MTLSPAQLAGQILPNSCPESRVDASHSPLSVPPEIASKLWCLSICSLHWRYWWVLLNQAGILKYSDWGRAHSQGKQVNCQEKQVTSNLKGFKNRSKNCKTSPKAIGFVYGYDWKSCITSSWLCHVPGSETKGVELLSSPQAGGGEDQNQKQRPLTQVCNIGHNKKNQKPSDFL